MPPSSPLCQHLDGLPLAIELAAARSKLLSPQALLLRLRSRLSLLTGGPVDQDPKHRTLRGTIDWSYNLLDAAEQHLFTRLAVFMGSCTLAAVEGVCSALVQHAPDTQHAVSQRVPGTQSSILDGLQSLLDKSMLWQAAGADGEPRFRMLETLREYALEQLEMSSDVEALWRQHAAYYLALAEQAEQAIGRPQSIVLAGPQSPMWVKRLATEHDNLRAALHWTLEHGETETALRLSGALGPFWQAHGHLTEGRHWLNQALASSSMEPTSVRAKALRWAGALALLQGGFDQACRLLTESLALYRTLGDTDGIAATLTDLGWVASCHGDLDRAHTCFAESLRLWRDVGDTHGSATALQQLGANALFTGDYPTAQAFLEESLELFRALGDKPGIAWTCDFLGWTLLYSGNAGQARVLFEANLAMQHELDDTYGIAHALMSLGYLAYEEGAYAQAQAQLARSLSLLQEQRNRWFSAPCLETLARVANAQQQPERAVQLFGAAEALREAIGAPLLPSERSLHAPWLAAVRTTLGETAFEAMRTEGRSMSLEQAIAYALAENGDSRAVGEQ